MTDSLGCHEVRELAPELALGVLAGQERAGALQHLATCSGCRRYVAELADAAEEMLLLTPSQQPPAGFESRVLKQLNHQPTTTRRRWLAATAAAAALAAVLSAIGVHMATDDDRKLAAQYRHTLRQASGQYFGALTLRDTSGRPAGSVFGYEGSTPWVFVVVRAPGTSGAYTVEVTTNEGKRYPLGTLTVTDGEGSWGRALPVALRDVAHVRLVGPGGVKFDADSRAPG